MKCWKVITTALIAMLPMMAQAEKVNSTPVNASSVLQTIFGLILVLAIIVLLGWLLKRSQYFHAAHHGQLKVLGAVSLGTREKAVLIQVGEQQLLLGVTPQQINTLHTLSEPLPVRETHIKQSDSFAEKLKQMMQQRGNS
ncbi:flagellar biosynthetic protein FliO [Methylophaga pinxianii]|uniref:flagellar biosynthetic protein FliO n=1 Tax=Methylophaga pinxianii TaxID=2881052 RepID=UPI001FF78793|nr:flagellar biosynthetic protein FliO [Methylophaga pinxianii]UPH46707.1 flagellar biosynthetic protein FliO [Methylophaga pinxianii]